MECLKHSVNPIRKQTKQKIQTFSLLPFKIVVIRYNTRLTTFVQLPETISKGLLLNRSQNGCHSIFDGIHFRKTCTFERGNRKKFQEPDQERKEGDQAQLPSPEPGMGVHGSHCVQGYFRGATSVFQSCATLNEPAGYAVAIGLKVLGKMRHLWFDIQKQITY